MRRMIGFAFVLVALLALNLIAAGDEAKSVTLKGKIGCAKCVLSLDETEKCQSVLVVEEKEAQATYYYLVKTDVTEEYDHACEGYKGAVVTGTVEEKDGKTWLTATNIAAADED